MARILLSNKEQGSYEYYFEPIAKGKTRIAITKFLKKYGFVRRIRVNPLDRLEKIKHRIEGVNVKDIRDKCMNQCSKEVTGLFTSDIEELVNITEKILEEALDCYNECISSITK